VKKHILIAKAQYNGKYKQMNINFTIITCEKTYTDSKSAIKSKYKQININFTIITCEKHILIAKAQYNGKYTKKKYLFNIFKVTKLSFQGMSHFKSQFFTLSDSFV